MQPSRVVMLLLIVSTAWAGTSRADEAEARAIIEKAVEAHGGQERLTKLRAVTIQFQGKFHGAGDGVEIAGEVIGYGPDRHKLDLQFRVGGETVRVVSALVGEGGWIQIGERTRDLTKGELAEARDLAYIGWVTTLEPLLRDAAFRFSPLGELKVGDRTTTGIKVSRKGRHDLDLYFDKESRLLLKAEGTVTERSGGKPVTEETVFEDYREVRGTPRPHRFFVRRNGKPFLEAEVTGYQLAEGLDDDVFARP